MQSSEKYFWTYPKLTAWLESNPEDKPKFLDVFNEIHGEVSEGLLDKSLKVLDKTFAKLYDNLSLEIPYGFDVDQVTEKHNLILVPNHQSHADYVAITYLFFKKFRRALHIAGGINLNMFLLGSYFRRTGAFFIRRSFGKDKIYRLGFEAYIFSLLSQNKILKFYFEGGRSRTGKLLSPRFGLFQMILEAHSQIKTSRSLMFMPVSIAHEHLPEEKAHAKELGGETKAKESMRQVFKIFRLFSKKLGSIYVRFGKGVVVKSGTASIKKTTQEVAFKCFRAVGDGMPITPTSLLSLILLDAPSGVTTWEEVEQKAKQIIEFCERFNIPLTPSLGEGFQEAKFNIHRALQILIGNKKVQVIQNENLGNTFYGVKNSERVHLLYFKNMILHHFLVPSILNVVLFNLKNGVFKTHQELNEFMLQKRNELKFEFYLASELEMLDFGLNIIKFATGRETQGVLDLFNLSTEEIGQVEKKIFNFSSSLSYINECYFLSSKALMHIGEDNEFDFKQFFGIYKEIFEIELEHGRVVQFSESFLLPLVESSLKFYEYSSCVEMTEDDKYRVVNVEKLQDYYRNFVADLSANVIMNLNAV